MHVLPDGESSCIYESSKYPDHLVLFLDMRRMTTICQHNFAIGTAVCLVVVQHGPHLCNHWLWRVNLCSRPTGDSTELPQETKVEQGRVGDNLIVCAMYP